MLNRGPACPLEQRVEQLRAFTPIGRCVVGDTSPSFCLEDDRETDERWERPVHWGALCVARLLTAHELTHSPLLTRGIGVGHGSEP